MGRAGLAFVLMAGCIACSEPSRSRAQSTASPVEVGMGEDVPTTPAGALQGNWRITRADDPNDAALLHLQIIHDGDVLTGDYVVFQPFCWIDRPLPQPPGDDCEFTDATGPLVGDVSEGTAVLSFRPGADQSEHRISLPAASGDRVNGVYTTPDGVGSVAITLERQTF